MVIRTEEQSRPKRRLLGYIVKLHDGTRSPKTPEPVTLRTAVGRWNGEAAGSYVVPVFAIPKRPPTTAPPVGVASAAIATSDAVASFVRGRQNEAAKKAGP